MHLPVLPKSKWVMEVLSFLGELPGQLPYAYLAGVVRRWAIIIRPSVVPQLLIQLHLHKYLAAASKLPIHPASLIIKHSV